MCLASSGSRSPAKARFSLACDRGPGGQVETHKTSRACARNWHTVVLSSFTLSEQVTWPSPQLGDGESGGGGGGPGAGRVRLTRKSLSGERRLRAMMQSTARLRPDNSPVS